MGDSSAGAVRILSNPVRHFHNVVRQRGRGRDGGGGGGRVEARGGRVETRGGGGRVEARLSEGGERKAEQEGE